MNRVLNFLARYWAVLFLVGLVTSIGYTNPLPVGGWLTGWDNLHPEFWSQMNISRSLSAVWQEYQGLGLLGGMGHAADLFRQLLLWIVGGLFPNNWLRYGYHLLMYLLGMIGTYFLLERVVLNKYPAGVRKMASLIACLFYALNLGTILYFYAPFEPYSTFWGMLPWEIFVLINYLENPKKKNLTWLFIVNILGVAQGYVQTLFLIYILCAGIIVTGHVITERSWKSLKHGIIGGLLILATNSFWILPAAYYLNTSVDEHNNSTQISFATEMFYLMNQGRGKLSDFIPMKLFYYDFTDWNTSGTSFDYFAPSWVKYYQNPLIVGITYVFAIVGLIGILSKSRFKLQFGWIFLVGLIGFLSAEKGISQMNELMRQNELFAQLFRNPYTKLIVPTVLTMSIFIASGLALMMNNKYFKYVIFITGIALALTLSWPIWQGEFFHKAERITMPNGYMELFDFMKNEADPTGRVGLLPAHYIWGWSNHDWGYRGSGFLWYGIEQPILDRAFDVWSAKNEGFYQEFSNAIYGGEEVGLEMVLHKYDVKYLLMDASVADAGFDKDIFAYDKSKSLFEKLGYREVFKRGFLTVWDTGLDTSQFVSAPGSYTIVSGDSAKTRKDVIFEELGPYVSIENQKTKESENQIYYPFANLMREEILDIRYTDTGITLGSDPPAVESAGWALPSGSDPVGRELIIPGWKVGDIVRIEYRDGEPLPAYYVDGQEGPRFLGKEKPEEGKNIIYARISEGEEWREYLRNQEFGIRNQEIVIEVPSAPQIYDFGTQGRGTVGNCDVLKRGTANKFSNQKFSNSQMESQATIYVADNRGAACDYVTMSELDTRLSYLMRMQGENKEGRSLKFFLYNTGSKRNDVEWLMAKDKFDQTFSLLPWSWDGYYTLNIETRSFGQRAENVINPVEVRWFPLEQIAGARIVPVRSDLPADESAGWDQPLRSDLRVTEVKKAGTWLYRVKVSADAEAMADEGGLLKLSQGYDEGWIAMESFDFAQDLRHVKVNGWANGWMVPASGVVTIFYWPQMLEYLGFGLLGVTVLGLIFVKRGGSH